MADGRTPALTHRAGGAGNGNGAVTQAEVREELGRILGSSGFRSSRRCQDFLRYVVESTVDGHSDLLKERTIGIDVFSKPVSYDPSEDATVRVKAGEVRKRLGLYYAGDGHADAVRIELPHGTYVPEFHRVTTAPEKAGQPGPPAQPRLRLPLVIAAIAIVLAAGAFAWVRSRAPASVLDEFWSPMLHGASPVLLSAAFVPVYTPRDQSATHPTDFILLNDQFVGGGDLVAVSRIASMLVRMDSAYRIKLGPDLSFSDLRTSPAVLVGYSYTRWKEISRQLRYFIDADRRPLMVTDNGAPTKWSLPNIQPDRHTDEDYAIVSRVFHPDTRAMLLEVAGITQYGTEAAAELVTRADLLVEALKGAPPGWQGKNLQFVLRVKVISGTPASQTVVASYFW